MALRVWLPLNGNLNNNGLSNLGPTSFSNITWKTDGKLGKCANGCGIYHLNQDIIPNNIWTVSAWVRCPSTWGQYNNIVICINDADMNTCHIYLSIINGTQLNIGFNNTAQRYTVNYTFESNKWYHIAASYNGTTATLYANGVLLGTSNITSAVTNCLNLAFGGRSTNAAGTSYTQSGVNLDINDVRIYDECLSPKQVKEISKGLVAHYKLDTPMNIDNLVRNLAYSVYNNFSSSGTTGSLIKLAERYNNCDVYRLTMTPNETSLSSFKTTLHGHGIYGFRKIFSANTKYCFWILWRPVTHNDVSVGGVASNIGGWTEIPSQEWRDGWYIVGQKRTGNVTEDKNDSIFISFKCPSAESGVPISVDFCCPHLVEGYDYILPEFNYTGTNNSYIQDCSGNGYALMKKGIQSFNTNSARYSGSTTLGGTCADYLYRDTFTWLASPFTFNCWVYQTSATSSSSGNENNTTQFIMNQGRDCGYAGFALCSSNGYARLFLGTNVSGTYYSLSDNTINLLNNWHMLTGTFDGSVAKLYVDGVQKAIKESSVDPSWEQTTCFAIGKMSYIATSGTTAYFPFVGSISDVRVYATALSADEILTMYKTSGIIDNKGNIYAYELKEE